MHNRDTVQSLGTFATCFAEQAWHASLNIRAQSGPEWIGAGLTDCCCVSRHGFDGTLKGLIQTSKQMFIAAKSYSLITINHYSHLPSATTFGKIYLES